ncbi:MAG: type II secretion system protein GspF [Deltaproteobacteria bacterium]|nr:MAG: type II secretion system protein GspF [Deltaproteobacteria bacterium]
MALFIYKASDPAGKITKSTVEAADESGAVAKIQELGLIPIRISPAGGQPGNISVPMGNPLDVFRNRITGKDVMVFTQDLSTLLDAGVPIDRSLAILMNIAENQRLKRLVGDVLKTIQGGSSLSDALSLHPKHFSDFYVNMVRAGETGGVLEDVLKRLGAYLERSQELKEFIKSAMVYPVFLMIVSGLSIIVLMTYVIPKFAAIFSDMGGEIPWSSRLLLSSSDLLRSYWWLLFAVCATLFFAVDRYRRTEGGRLKIDRLKLNLPVIRDFVKKSEAARFTRTLGTLVRSGVPIVTGLELVRNIIGNSVISASMGQVIRKVKEGDRLANPLEQTRLFPSLAIQMITVGEETGRLEDMLLRVADNYEKILRNTVKRFIGFLEPALILAMALIVGFIVISMLMAIFSMNELPF